MKFDLKAELENLGFCRILTEPFTWHHDNGITFEFAEYKAGMCYWVFHDRNTGFILGKNISPKVLLKKLKKYLEEL